MKQYYKRYLPHLTPAGGIFFVTSVLKNALAKSSIQQLQAEKATVLQQLQAAQYQELTDTLFQTKLIETHKRYFAKVDRILDTATLGKHHLKNANIAQIVADKFHQYDNIYYRLEAYTIMSNHFHLLIDTSFQLDQLPDGVKPNLDNYTPLSKIMNLIKGGSAHSINKLMKRTGAFWQIESYDHLVRNDEEQYNIRRYILNNPVQAGLVNNWKDYPFSYALNDI